MTASYDMSCGLGNAPEEWQGPCDAGVMFLRQAIAQEEAGRRIYTVSSASLVQRAIAPLLFEVVASTRSNLRLDLRGVGPTKPGLLAVGRRTAL